MALDDKTKPIQGKDQQNQGGSDRTNPHRPTSGTSSPGQTPGNTRTQPDDQELDEQGRATGQMSNQKESNRMVGTNAGGKTSGDCCSSAGDSKKSNG